jgi:hypothetical protein
VLLYALIIASKATPITAHTAKVLPTKTKKNWLIAVYNK